VVYPSFAARADRRVPCVEGRRRLRPLPGRRTANSELVRTSWFSFVAPASGHISIETTSSTFWDNYITLFSGADCTNPAGMTQLGYNDDANGTAQAALMNVTCLTPGTTYYIQMRGFANSIGQAGIVLTDLGNVAPVISGISSNIVATAAAGTCGATVTWTAPTAADDQSCATTLTSNFNSGDTFPVGVTTVTYTATDVQVGKYCFFHCYSERYSIANNHCSC